MPLASNFWNPLDRSLTALLKNKMLDAGFSTEIFATRV